MAVRLGAYRSLLWQYEFYFISLLIYLFGGGGEGGKWPGQREAIPFGRVAIRNIHCRFYFFLMCCQSTVRAIKSKLKGNFTFEQYCCEANTREDEMH